MKKYLLTIQTHNDPTCGFIGFYFQAIVDLDFDFQQEVLACKCDKDLAKLSNKVFSKADVKKWMPDTYIDQIPCRIMAWFEIKENNYETTMA